MFSKVIEVIGKYASYLNLVLIILIVLDVIFRYVFNSSQTWIIELEWHLFALIFLLGIAYTLQVDEHIRVDIIYNGRGERYKRNVNILGHIFFLIPWCYIGIVKSYKIFINSWAFGEGSPDPGGLPGRFVIKGFIVLAFVLLLIQGLIQILNYFIKKPTQE